jgi:hypothetical protein
MNLNWHSPLPALSERQAIVMSLRPTFGFRPTEGGARRTVNGVERFETFLFRVLAGLLVLTLLDCAVAVQHIAYVRQKGALCRQLRRQELELLNVTEAYRSLTASFVAKSSTDLPEPASETSGTKIPPRKNSPRG